MVAYRDPQAPPADEDVAALAELGRRVSSTKMWVLMPIILGALAAGFTTALLHASGYLALFGRFADGSYLVNKGSLTVAMLLGGAVVLVPGLGIYKLALRATVARWRVDARERFRLDEATIDDLANMFAPRRAAEVVATTVSPASEAPRFRRRRRARGPGASGASGA